MVTGLPAEKCLVHTQYLGGGFGRRGGADYVTEAVEIAKAMSPTPVKLTWSREDDLQHDTYRPASYVKFAGGLDAQGSPVSFSARVVCPPFGGNGTAVEGIQDMQYAIPNVQVEFTAPDTGTPVSYWRSVGYSQNTYFMEAFIDEMAAAAGKDPVEFRRKLLAGTPRLLNVLNIAADKGRLGQAAAGRPLPRRRRGEQHRQLQRAGGRSFRHARQGESSSRGLRGRLRAGDQSRHHRGSRSRAASFTA